MIQFLLPLLLPIWLFAHQSGLSYIKITEDKAHHISVVYKTPLQDLNANPIEIHYPHECFKTEQFPHDIHKGFIIQKYKLECSSGGLFGKRIWIKGLIKQNRGVLIEYQNPSLKQSRLLRAESPFILIDAKSSKLTLFISYLKLGIHHILSGYDHLLFVLCLLILAKNLKALLFAVTAFTLAHSITLASAMLGVVNLPVAFIEAMIALSILFLARELVQTQQNTLTKKHLEYVAFIFGLLHGFGFSNVLKSIGLADDALALSLFSFNLGIEIGQLLFILAVSLIYYLVKRLIKRPLLEIKVYVGYFVGILSAFWFIQRVLAF